MRPFLVALGYLLGGFTGLHNRRRQVGGRGHGDVVAVRWPQFPDPVRAMPEAEQFALDPLVVAEWGRLTSSFPQSYVSL